MEQNRFWDLLAKKKSGEATPEEQLELKQYFIQNAALVEVINQIDALWNSSFQPGEEIGEQQTALAWSSIQQKISTPLPLEPDAAIAVDNSRQSIKMFYRLVAAAAVFLAIISTGWFLIRSHQKNQQVKQNIVSTKNGSKSKIELPDGTQVWLNAGSKLIYDENYGKQYRKLQLVGEAYFDVVHNAEMPFIVKTGAMNIKVLGTAFNVRSYPDDATSEATLIRGSIEVSFPGKQMNRLVLKPREKITVLNKDTLLSNTLASRPLLQSTDQVKSIPAITLSALTYNNADSSVIETSWVMHKMIFRRKDFGALAKDMERWFNVSIQFEDSTLLTKKFTGTFKNENIKDVLIALQLSYPFHFRFGKNGDTVYIFEK